MNAEPIGEIETKYIESCHNSFLIYIHKNKLNEFINIQTYRLATFSLFLWIAVVRKIIIEVII